MSARFRNTYDLGIGELGRPEWHQHANCRGMGTELFFDHPGSKQAAEICEGCPVWLECRAQGQHERFGVWGGVTHGVRWQREDTRTSANRRRPRGLDRTNTCAVDSIAKSEPGAVRPARALAKHTGGA